MMFAVDKFCVVTACVYWQLNVTHASQWGNFMRRDYHTHLIKMGSNKSNLCFVWLHSIEAFYDTGT